MNFKILTKNKEINNTILIGKNGVIRMKNQMAQKHNFNRTDRWVVAINQDEKPSKSVYLIKNYCFEGVRGTKMRVLNDSWVLKCDTLQQESKIKPPLRCKAEAFAEANYEGIRLILP